MESSAYILYVDDDMEDCQLLTDAIHMYSKIDVKYAVNANAAIRRLKECPENAPSLIVLDLNMPGMDGKGTFLELKLILGVEVYPALLMATAPRAADIEFAENNGLLLIKKTNTLQGYADIAKTIVQIINSGCNLNRAV